MPSYSPESAEASSSRSSVFLRIRRLKVVLLPVFSTWERMGVVLGKQSCWSGCHVSSSHCWAIERGTGGDRGGQLHWEKQWFILFHLVCSGKGKHPMHPGFGILWGSSQHVIDFMERVEKWKEQCNMRCLWTETTVWICGFSTFSTMKSVENLNTVNCITLSKDFSLKHTF